MNLTSLPTFFVHEDKILINKVALRFVEGNLVLAGSLDVAEPSRFETLSVSDKLTAKIIEAETVKVRNLITDWEFKTDESSTNSLVWSYGSEESLDGKGLTWQHNEVSVQLLYKTGGDLWTNANVSLSENSTVKINNNVILSKTTLGESVIYSNLQQVGELASLSVSGDAEFQNKVGIKKLNVNEINSLVTFNDAIFVNGKVTINELLTVDSLCAKEILDESGKKIKLDEYRGNVESDLFGKGLTWSYADTIYQFIYGNGGRIWSNLNLDIGAANSYRINDIPVLTIDELGPQVTKSNLQRVGTLKNLKVSGNAEFGEYAFFNGDMMRVGFGTEEPDAALHIHDFGVDIVLGSQEQNTASIGVKTYHDLNIITDNTTRMLVKNSGEIVFGNAASKNANVTIFGTLKVDNLVSDSRIERFSPLEFKSSNDTEIWGLGLVWRGLEQQHSFLLAPDPNRILSTEHIDIAADKSYHVNGQSVLSETAIGDSVVNSKLTSLGTLTSLTVVGPSSFTGVTTIANLNLSGSVTADRQVILKANGDTVYHADENGISIGNNQNTARPVKIFGPLSVGVNNPDPELGFTVAGDVSLGGKKFVSNGNIPASGTFNKGDICWNTSPTPGNFIGWVCIVSGTPGQWAPFGPIGN